MRDSAKSAAPRTGTEAARAVSEARDMIEFGRILCTIDFSEFSPLTLDHALALACWYKAKLTVLHVVRNMPVMDVPPVMLTEEQRRRLEGELRRLVGPAAHGVQIDYVVREAADVRHAILAEADALHADLLVIGSHGRSGFHAVMLGSVTESVLHRAALPIMVVPRRAPHAEPGAPVRFARILCPVDFSEASLRALEYAEALAQECSAELTLLHVMDASLHLRDYMAAERRAEVAQLHAAARAESLRRLRQLIPDRVKTYCHTETEASEGVVYGEVLRAAADRRSDLIVMGVQGRGAFDLLVFGSNTARVVRRANCPVLVVPAARRKAAIA